MLLVTLPAFYTYFYGLLRCFIATVIHFVCNNKINIVYWHLTFMYNFNDILDITLPHLLMRSTINTNITGANWKIRRQNDVAYCISSPWRNK